MARQRILWLSHILPWPPKGGLMQRSYYLMREVARQHDVHVVAFSQRAHQASDEARAQATTEIARFAKVRQVLALPEDRYPGGRAALALRSLLPGPPYTIRWGMCRQYRAAVQDALTSFHPNLVHFDTLSLAPYRDLVGKVPAVLNHHNIESQMLLRRARLDRNPFARFYFWQEGKRLAAYERQVARDFRLHFVCSDLDRQRLLNAVGSVAIEVVPNGVDLEYFTPAPDETAQQPDSMIFVGGLGWYPNADAMRYFIREVWPLLSARRPHSELRLIGRNPPQDILEAGQRDSRIKVMGFVDDIRPVVHQAMIYICPIRDGGGTRLKMIDAMAMGKAIVADPVAAEGLGLTHNRDVLLAETPADMVECCVRLFDDVELRRNLGHAARQRAERAFGFDAIGAHLSHVYETLADDSTAAASSGTQI